MGQRIQFILQKRIAHTHTHTAVQRWFLANLHCDWVWWHAALGSFIRDLDTIYYTKIHISLERLSFGEKKIMMEEKQPKMKRMRWKTRETMMKCTHNNLAHSLVRSFCRSLSLAEKLSNFFNANVYSFCGWDSWFCCWIRLHEKPGRQLL